MAQFKIITPNVEVNGQTVLSVANGLNAMKNLGLKILEENGISNPKPEAWYSQGLWLNSFKQISEKIGDKTLNIIGKSIPDNAKFPPEINDIYKALASIDIAYHMNHRLNNNILFNITTGKMFEGIGHYNYRKISDNEIEIKCDNPYPCEFDKGIIEQMAKRFKPAGAFIRIDHDELKGCRKKGGNICTYLISW
jgi:hypothetical protein